MITAEQVRDAMRERGLSQGKLSELSKVSKPVISNWLNGVREPSDISKTRIAFALDLLEPGDADDKQVSAALSPDPEPEEIPALEPLEPLEPADDVPAARPGRDTDTDYLTDEDLAVDEIMDALGMSNPAPDPEIETEPETEVTPVPELSLALSGDSPAELIWELTRLTGYTLDSDSMTILLPRDSDLERFCCNLQTLDTMLDCGDIDADAHRTVCESLLAHYKEEV